MATQTLPNSSAAAVEGPTPTPAGALELIEAANLISAANRAYAVLAAAAFVAGCFLLCGLVATWRAGRHVIWLDRLLWAFCGLQLLLLLFSLYNVVHRPYSLRTAALGCAALSFAINTTSTCGLLVLALMAYSLALDPPSDGFLRRPGICVALVVLTSICITLLLDGLRGPSDGFRRETDCFMDPVHAGVSYAVAKLCLAFLMPYGLQLALLICGCVRQKQSNRRFLSGSEQGPVLLAFGATLLFCHLFYAAALVRAARLQARGELSHRQRAFVSVAELVFFAGSCACLTLVPLVHRPSRKKLAGQFGRAADLCPRPARAQPSRNIITPHIEITDTLQDIES
ncbi:uncharacterized protein LOC133495320 [Syngnathoides biaculeatus]|uniref:uncharacterized protein LOC133495320 n=1 Tax=Syngnathoides biaculeatus TaxID=300417 RepID=UPI002ADDFA65|nr:uncharacterized protein LOC133495320 [Syngnathoides biaculeatus]